MRGASCGAQIMRRSPATRPIRKHQALALTSIMEITLQRESASAIRTTADLPRKRSLSSREIVLLSPGGLNFKVLTVFGAVTDPTPLPSIDYAAPRRLEFLSMTGRRSSITIGGRSLSRREFRITNLTTFIPVNKKSKRMNVFRRGPFRLGLEMYIIRANHTRVTNANFA